MSGILTRLRDSGWRSVAGRRASHLLGRVQRPVLTITGFGLLTCSAWDVSRPLGLLAGGLSCLIIEALSKGDGA